MAVAPFFIVGSARSGTTLLRMIFNAHPAVAVPPESRFIVELWRGEDPVDRRWFLDALAAHKRYIAWELPIETVEQELPSSATVAYRAAVAAAFRAYAKHRRKEVWGDKTPRYIEHITFLAKLFPTARFVHLVRDGRNVALSYADVPFGPKTLPKAATLWRERVTAGMTQGRALGADRYIEVRYESLVTDLETETKALCAFLGLDFDRRMLDYAERSRSDVLPRAKDYNPNITKPPIENVRSWQTTMPDSQVAIFEAIAGEVLSELGYPRRHPTPSLGARLAAGLGRLGAPIGRLKP